MAMFGIGEVISNLTGESGRVLLTKKVTGLLLSRDDLKRIVGPILRGTALGSILGILPGGGAMLSSFASYVVEKKVANPKVPVR